MDRINGYFPGLTSRQSAQFKLLTEGYLFWNERINVISRKDIPHLEERHLLHSLAIAKFMDFIPGTRILDVGTGGGLPGLPLAVLFPGCSFTLVDSIAKKIHVTEELARHAGIENVRTVRTRAEHLREKYDFIISRAVTSLPTFHGWVSKLVHPDSRNQRPNGIIALKGGALQEEIAPFGEQVSLHPVSTWFSEEWFRQKYVVHLPVN